MFDHFKISIKGFAFVIFVSSLIICPFLLIVSNRVLFFYSLPMAPFNVTMKIHFSIKLMPVYTRII